MLTASLVNIRVDNFNLLLIIIRQGSSETNIPFKSNNRLGPERPNQIRKHLRDSFGQAVYDRRRERHPHSIRIFGRIQGIVLVVAAGLLEKKIKDGNAGEILLHETMEVFIMTLPRKDGGFKRARVCMG